jgi:hypothetical protein
VYTLTDDDKRNDSPGTPEVDGARRGAGLNPIAAVMHAPTIKLAVTRPASARDDVLT